MGKNEIQTNHLDQTFVSLPVSHVFSFMIRRGVYPEKNNLAFCDSILSDFFPVCLHFLNDTHQNAKIRLKYLHCEIPVHIEDPCKWLIQVG